MKTFNQFISEAQSKAVVMHFGKWRIPHAGYGEVVKKVKEVASEHNADHDIVLSNAGHPLTPQKKLEHAKKMFPKTKIRLAGNEEPTFLQQAAKLHKKGYKTLHVVVGSDRKKEIESKLNQYNGKPDKTGKVLYHFPGGIHVHVAGEERKEGAQGTAGASSTNQEKHAREGNFEAFKANSPVGVKPEHVKKLYDDVRSSLNKQ